MQDTEQPITHILTQRAVLIGWSAVGAAPTVLQAPAADPVLYFLSVLYWYL